MFASIGELRRLCILGDAKWAEEEFRAKVYNYVGGGQLKSGKFKILSNFSY